MAIQPYALARKRPKLNWLSKTYSPFGVPGLPGGPGFAPGAPIGVLTPPGLPDRQNPQPRTGGAAGNPYADLINSMLAQTRADIRAESISDAAQRDAAIKRMLISYGQAPNLAGFSRESQGVLGKVLDPRTQALIAQNTAEGTSIFARGEAANRQQMERIPAAMAGRGAFRSGETGWALGQQAQAKKISDFDIVNELVGNVEGAVGGYAANERARIRAENEAAQEAAFRLAELYAGDDLTPDGTGGTPGYGATTTPASANPRASNRMLSKRQWLKLHPRGNYANYVRAWRRQHPAYVGGQHLYPSAPRSWY